MFYFAFSPNLLKTEIAIFCHVHPRLWTLLVWSVQQLVLRYVSPMFPLDIAPACAIQQDVKIYQE